MMRATLESVTSSAVRSSAGLPSSTTSGSVFGEAPLFPHHSENSRGSNNNNNGKDASKTVRFSRFWYWFRLSLPLTAPLSFVLFFLVPSLFVNTTEGFIFFGACLSIVFCSLALLSYLHIPQWRRHPSSLMIQICLMSVAVSLLCMLTSAPTGSLQDFTDAEEVEIINANRESKRERERDRLALCVLMSFFLQLTLLAREMWIFTLSLDLLTSITNPFASYQQNLRKYHAIIWCVGVGVAALLALEGECQGEFLSNGTCWLHIESLFSACFWGYFMSWVILFYLVALVVLLYAYARIRKGLESTFALRFRFVLHTLRVVFFYFFYGLCLAVLFLVLYLCTTQHHLVSTEHRTLRYVRHWLAFGIAARGFFDALVWFFSHGFTHTHSERHTHTERHSQSQSNSGRVSASQRALTAIAAAEQRERERDRAIGEYISVEHLSDDRASEGATHNHTDTQTQSDVEQPLLANAHTQAHNMRAVSFHHTRDVPATPQSNGYAFARTRASSMHTHALTAAPLGEHDVSPQLNLALRKEVLQLVTQGITESVTRNITREREREREKERECSRRHRNASTPPHNTPTQPHLFSRFSLFTSNNAKGNNEHSSSLEHQNERESDVSLTHTNSLDHNTLERVRLSDASERAHTTTHTPPHTPSHTAQAPPRSSVRVRERDRESVWHRSLRHTFSLFTHTRTAHPHEEHDEEDEEERDGENEEEGNADEGEYESGAERETEGEEEENTHTVTDALHSLLSVVGAVRPGEYGVDHVDSRLNASIHIALTQQQQHQQPHSVRASVSHTQQLSLAMRGSVFDPHHRALPNNTTNPVKRLWTDAQLYADSRAPFIPSSPGDPSFTPSEQSSESHFSDSSSLSHSLSHSHTLSQSSLAQSLSSHTLAHLPHRPSTTRRGRNSRRRQRRRKRTPPPAEVVFLLNDTHAFRDFRPATFRKLRALCCEDLSEERYLSLVTQPAKEKLSEGKSGAFFFLCGEGEIVVKTVEKHEALTLLSILDRYFAHLLLNPQSLLVRFLGLHSIKLYGNEFYFVVMKNVFPAGLLLNERYDIKGSWIQRNANISSLSTPGKLSTCRYCGEVFVEGNNSASVCSEVVGSHEASVTLKDNDLTSKIRLYPDDSFQVIETLFSDSDALCAMGVTDYSLLVGVRFARYDVDALHRQQSLSQSAVNGEFFPVRSSLAQDITPLSIAATTAAAAATVSSPSRINRSNYNNNNDNINTNNNINDYSNNMNSPNNNHGDANRRMFELTFHTGTTQTVSTHKVTYAGFPARVVIAPKEYHFGVIDVLQTWSLSKQLERFVKVYLLGQPAEGISCADPQAFKERFQRKIMRIIEHANIAREVTGSWQGKREVGSAFPLVEDSHH